MKTVKPMKAKNAMKAMHSRQRKRSSSKHMEEDDEDDEVTEYEEMNGDKEEEAESAKEETETTDDGPGTPKSASSAIRIWAEKTRDGVPWKKPNKASVWAYDRLKALDRQEGGNKHMTAYNACKGTKQKQRIQMKLALDMNGYVKDMQAFENQYGGEESNAAQVEGWMMPAEIAKLEGLPEAMAHDEMEDMVKDLAAEWNAQSRPHPCQAWAQKGVLQYHWRKLGHKTTTWKRGKVVGLNKCREIDPTDIKAQSRMIEDELDAEYDGKMEDEPETTTTRSKVKKSKEEKQKEKADKEQKKHEDILNIFLIKLHWPF